MNRMNRRYFLKAAGSTLMGLGLMANLSALSQVRTAKARSVEFTLLARYDHKEELLKSASADSVDWQAFRNAAPRTFSTLNLVEEFAYNTDAEVVSDTVPDWINDDLSYAEQQTVDNLNSYMEYYDFNQYNSPVYNVNNVYFYGVDHASDTNTCTAFYERGRDGLRHLGNSRYPMIWGPVLAGLTFASEDWDHEYYSALEGIFPSLFNYVMGWFDESSPTYYARTAAGNVRVDYQADPATSTGIISVKAQDESDVLFHYDYKVRY